jgi:hypothetical protein
MVPLNKARIAAISFITALYHSQKQNCFARRGVRPHMPGTDFSRG